MKADAKQPNMVLAHKWESLGFKPPFTCVGVFSLPSQAMREANPSACNNMMSNAPKGFSFGSCSVCGTGLVHNFLIIDGTGAKFTVGSDCVAKIGNTKLIASIEKQRLAHNRGMARVKREERRKAENDARELRLDSERAANGGLTNYELQEKERDDALRAKRDTVSKENQWLTTPLRKCWMSDTIDALIEGRCHFTELGSVTIKRLSVEYGKLAGRANSKAFSDKESEFWQLLDTMTAKYKK